ncbi:PQ-loop repeat-containing protein 1 [Mortierella sp. AM989]|nr:PQ-loop repeat-containing protein 1 [Mortierella sp. AM989]
MVVGPVSGYFHQYYTMHKMKTSIGFSSVTCGVLLVSRFDVALLYQSILMTIVQIFLLELCVRFYPWTVQLPVPVTHSIPSSRLNANNNNANINRGNSSTSSINTSRSNSRISSPNALGIEATVPLPQAIQNYRSKSTAGFSPAILLMWVIGDSFKTYYYIKTSAKYQFVGCGIIQLCIDCVIITQTVIYSKYWKDAMRRRDGVFGIVNPSHSLSSQDHVGGATGRSSSEALLAGGDDDDDHQERH